MLPDYSLKVGRSMARLECALGTGTVSSSSGGSLRVCGTRVDCGSKPVGLAGWQGGFVIPG
jgi:hypothetical protein